MFALKIDSENNFCNIELTDNVLNKKIFSPVKSEKYNTSCLFLCTLQLFVLITHLWELCIRNSRMDRQCIAGYRCTQVDCLLLDSWYWSHKNQGKDFDI